MTLEEILKEKSLSDEQIKAITSKMAENKLYTTSESDAEGRLKELQSNFDSKNQEHLEAVALIERLKKDNAGNEEFQTQITNYNSKVIALQAELEQIKIDSALKVALIEAKVSDVDYITFKVKEKGEIKLDDNGKIKGINDTISALKIQYPAQFSSDAAEKRIEEQKLPAGELKNEHGVTKEQFNKMGYQDRVKLYNENPDIYKEYSGRN